MNPRDYEQELRAAFDDLLKKLQAARYGSYSLNIKVHDGQIRELDLHSTEKLRITREPDRRG